MSIRVSRLSGFGATDATEPQRVYLRQASQVDVYDLFGNGLIQSFTSLSCGAAETTPHSGLAVSPDNRYFLTSGTTGTGAYNLDTGAELFFLANANQCRPAISGGYIAFAQGSLGTNTRIVETTGWTTVTTFDPVMGGREVYAWSNDGTKLAIGDSNGLVQIFETTGWTAYSNQVDYGESVYALSFSPDDALLAVGHDTSGADELTVITVGTTLSTATTKPYSSPGILDVAFSADGARLYVVRESADAGAIEAWNVSGWTSAYTSAASTYNNQSIAISQTENSIVVGGTNFEALKYLDKSLKVIRLNSTATGSIYGIAMEKPR